MSTMSIVSSRRARRKATEADNLTRLEVAEELAEELRVRGEKAIKYLEARRSRNHWSQTVDQIIRSARG